MAKPLIRQNCDAGKRFESRLVNHLVGIGVSDARRVPFSGASKQVGKSDVRATIGEYPHLIEAKKSRGDSIGIKKEWLDKNKMEAEEEGSLSLLAIGFQNSDIYVVVPLDHYVEMMKQVKQ